MTSKIVVVLGGGVGGLSVAKICAGGWAGSTRC